MQGGSDEEQRSTMFYLKQRVIVVNLIVMAYMWAACSFGYYMIIFYLKYLPGNIYNNSLSSGGTDLIAVVFSGVLYGKLGLRKTVTGLFTLSTIGGLMIIFLGENSTTLVPIFVVITKFGISGGFVLCYCSTVDVFPTLFCSTGLGICNFGARVLSILAPIVAEEPAPIPMIVLTCLTLGGIAMI